jgi:hypothetical protein
VPASAFLGHAQTQPQATAKDDKDPRIWPYNMRSMARVFGNVGGWWSFLKENDKAAFLDGFQEAMRQANKQEKTVCEAMRQEMVKDTNTPVKAISAMIFVCSSVSDTGDYDKVTIKDLNDFYSDPANQPIVLDWSMAYLRDKASGRKTKGQLLDALEAGQKDIHDCSKYPNLCKLGGQ